MILSSGTPISFRSVALHRFIVWAITICSLASAVSFLIPTAYAGTALQAAFDTGSVNADFALGGSTATTSGSTSSFLVSPGKGGSGSALELPPNGSLSYPLANNVSLSSGSISLDVNFPKGPSTPPLPTLASPGSPISVSYDPATDSVVYLNTSASTPFIKYKVDGSAIEAYGTLATSSPGSGQFSNLAKGIWHDTATDFYYIADNQGSRIVKTKFDGTGWASYGSLVLGFNNPVGIGYDAATGYIYTLSPGRNCVIRTKIDGTGLSCWGSAGTGVGQFNNGASSLTYDPTTDMLYIADTGNNRIVKTQFGGNGWTAYGTTGTGVGQFTSPTGISYDSTNNDLYVLDASNNRIVKTKIDGTGWTSLGSTAGSGTNQFSLSSFSNKPDLWYDNTYGYVYVADVNNGRIIKTKIDGTGWTVIKPPTAFSTTLGTSATNLYVDPTTKYIFSTTTGGRIVRTTRTGAGWKSFGTIGSGTNQFSSTMGGISYDPATEYIYVADTGNNRIIRTKIDGTGWLVFGTTGSGTNQFSAPRGLAFDATTSTIFVFDATNRRIVSTKIDGTGWSTYGTSGSGVGQFGNSNGPLSYNPATGYLYVTDNGNGRVIRMTPDGSSWLSIVTTCQSSTYDSINNVLYCTSGASTATITKVAMDGTVLQSFGSNGFGTTQFSGIGGLSIDPTTQILYVNDTLNSRLSLISLPSLARENLTGIASSQVLFDAGSTFGLTITYDIFTNLVSAQLKTASTLVQLTAPLTTNSAGTWTNISFNYDVPNGTYSLLFNGVPVDTATDISRTAASLPPGSLFIAGSSNGGSTFTGNVDNISIQLSGSDVTAPTLPTSITAKTASSGTLISQGSAPLSTGWRNNPQPEFSWTGSTDTSGVAGYIVDWNTSNTAPVAISPNTYQTTNSFVPSGLVSGTTYNLWLRPVDTAGNIASASIVATYKYDSTTPLPPGNVSVSPAGYSNTNDFTFTWPTSGDLAASDPGAPSTGSGLAGYQYKTGASSGPLATWSSTVTGASIHLPTAAYQIGENTFFVRSIDGAGNASVAVASAFYYTSNAPSAPENLTVTPASSDISPATTNSFAFSWSVPSLIQGSVKAYHYSINTPPTGANTLTTSATSLSTGPYATQQGRNIFYVVAEDQAGNIDYANPAQVDFYTLTPSPGAPTSLLATDSSIRGAQYAITLAWQASPSATLASFDAYDIYRSSDSEGLSRIGSSNSTTYIDSTVAANQTYTYIVRTRDNAGNSSIPSDAVTSTASGRFTSPATILVQPTVIQSATTASVTWLTDRVCSSFVTFGTDRAAVERGSESQQTGQADSVTSHQVTLKDLAANTQYYARALCIDADGNRSLSNVVSFATNENPSLRNVRIRSVGSTSATISWESTLTTSATLRYGVTSQYGRQVQDESAGGTTTHVASLEGLSDGTLYHFRIDSLATDGTSIVSDDYTFTTNQLPKVLGTPAITQSASQPGMLTILWNTNVPTTSVTTFTANGKYYEASNAEPTTSHALVIQDAPDDTLLSITVSGIDSESVAVTAQALFKTLPDTRPPIISDVAVRQSIKGTDAGATAQLTVTWTTDTPSSSRLRYGVGTTTGELTRDAGSETRTISHSVTLENLSPVSILSYQPASTDAVGNEGLGQRRSLITPAASVSATSIITQKLRTVFGFFDRLVR